VACIAGFFRPVTVARAMLTSLRVLSGSALACLFAAVAAGASSEWKDAKGAVFKGEPVEVVGPLAVWRTGATSSKFLPTRALSAEDCARFHAATASRAPRAAKLSEAQGEATREFVGRLLRLDGGKAKPADLAALPEPELLIVLAASRRAEGFLTLMDNLGPFASRMAKVYQGRVAAVVLSAWDSGQEPRALPGGRTWMMVDPKKQADMKVMARFVPGGGFFMMLMTREGVPLFGVPGETVDDVQRFVDGATDMLWQIHPANPRTVRDRAHYLQTARAREFAQGATPPLLLLDPLRPDALRVRGVKRVEAELAVSAAGKIEAATLLPESDVPEALAAPLAEALKRNPFVLPAVENGVPAAGTARYSLTIGPANPQLAADAAWVTGEARVDVPIKSWLVLKPIKVPEQVFAGISSVGADGTVMMQAVTAGTSNKVSNASQVNSFNSDWFDREGAGTVRPEAGQKQDVDGEKLTWKKLTPERGGLVDFLGSADNLDYCIGYAWTEVEVPEAMDGWLGIGSDDGLRIWVNGEPVNDRWTQRTSRLDDDVVPLRLKAGKNQILIKIQNVRGRWSFTARLRVRGA